VTRFSYTQQHTAHCNNGSQTGSHYEIQVARLNFGRSVNNTFCTNRNSRCIFWLRSRMGEKRLTGLDLSAVFSLIRDLSQVFTLLRVEKLRSTLAVLTGKVKGIVRNELMNGNVWRSHATNPSSDVPGTASSGFMACVRTHLCRHKSTSHWRCPEFRLWNDRLSLRLRSLEVECIWHVCSILLGS